MRTRAIVQHGPRRLELCELAVPEIDDDTALLRVEACGICGTDVEQYAGLIPARFPLVPGHEPVGVIDRIGERASARWGVKVGDRVAVENYLPCAHCTPCLEGRYPRCEGRGGNFGYGHIGLAHPPGIWGAFSEYMHLDPASILHPLRPDVPASVATLFNPLGAGYRWAIEIGGVRPGHTVVILGAGQRGIAAAIAARAAGAEHVIMTGLSSDAHKLQLARRLGVDDVLDVETDDTFTRVFELTDGRCADVVIEVASSAPQPVIDAMHCAKAGGTVVLAGLKGFKPIPDFVSDYVVIKELTVKGVFAVTNRAYRWAVGLLEAGTLPLELLHTHDFALADTDLAIRTLAGEITGAHPIHCSVVPPGVTHGHPSAGAAPNTVR
jgi:threonine dehydrogenase-like Zn-dependent dehydrogenase